MLPDDERLTRRRDFAAVYERKRFWAGPLVVLHVRRYAKSGKEMPGSDLPGDNAENKPELETRRFGFSVSKKVSKAAHDRNRIKRRLREICRHHGAEWQHGFDAVFVVRTGSVDASYHDLEQAVCHAMRRAGLVKETTAAAGTPITQLAKTVQSARTEAQPET